MGSESKVHFQSKHARAHTGVNFVSGALLEKHLAHPATNLLH
jgi:hypothetical protein